MKNYIQIEKNTPPIKNKRNQHNHKHQIIKQIIQNNKLIININRIIMYTIKQIIAIKKLQFEIQ